MIMIDDLRGAASQLGSDERCLNLNGWPHHHHCRRQRSASSPLEHARVREHAERAPAAGGAEV